MTHFWPPRKTDAMDIAVWSEFPEELQELVFARLPWPLIYQVRILSKEWNQKLMRGAKDSQWKQACARAQPMSFALFAPAEGLGSFTVNIFEITSNRWRSFEISLGNATMWDKIKAVFASDGGLVCLLLKVYSESREIPRLVFVYNPLTRVWKQLPPLYDIVHEKVMMQLIMDLETKLYRVIVVDYGKMGNVVNIYHSETGLWTKADASASGEVVYGFPYTSLPQREVSRYLSSFDSNTFRFPPSSYNFADGLVHEIGANFPENTARDPVFVRDHVFLLKNRGSAGGLLRHCIEEYQAVNCGASWTFLKQYPLNLLPRTLHVKPNGACWFPYFLACKDFLLLFVSNSLGEKNLRDFMFIYQFSQEEWREIPMMPGCNNFPFDLQQMCELRFDSVP